MREVCIDNTFDAWRVAARGLLARDVTPEEVLWRTRGIDDAWLSGLAPPEEAESSAGPTASASRVPRDFVSLARTVACCRDPARWDALYRALWRLARGEPHLLRLATDDDVGRLRGMEKAVRFDAHKMKAFVRFRRVNPPEDADAAGGERYAAWHRPEHFVLRLTAPFFARRFAAMRWAILTPDDSASWDGEALTFGPGAPRAAAPAGDDLEDLWRTYYAHIFNPARVKVRAMKKEMPVRYWPTLPEASLIPELLRDAPRRVGAMLAAGEEDPAPAGAERFLPATVSLPTLRAAAASCRGCDLCQSATQTVFGEGPADARAVLVGEQPGDSEDLAGRPFVGPAGQLLDRALAEAGLDRGAVYVTNAVKHFKWTPRGKRRVHAKPNAREVAACKPWLAAEMTALKPAMIVCLGGTAAQAVLGPHVRITRDRGRVFTHDWSPWVMPTLHPSALLRIPDEALRAQTYRAFVSDLTRAAERYREIAAAPR